MFDPVTPATELHSRLGRVGSIEAWNPWESRKSVAHAKWFVSKVASISYGNEEAKNPEALFDQIVRRGHLSCLEFVPCPGEFGTGAPFSLPAGSLRHNTHLLSYGDDPFSWGSAVVQAGNGHHGASAFLVEAPIFVARQWMRHRSFSYLEMSRRYTKGSKVAWTYYGKHGTDDFMGVDVGTHPNGIHINTDFWRTCEAEYERRLESGWSNEIARGCMPVEAMTRFWTAGFDRDWEAFCNLRSDEHAQPEIRVFSDYIRKHLESKEAKG